MLILGQAATLSGTESRCARLPVAFLKGLPREAHMSSLGH